MYIMIHKLDLYINIAFHPNNQNITLSVKRKKIFKRDFKRCVGVITAKTVKNVFE